MDFGIIAAALSRLDNHAITDVSILDFESMTAAQENDFELHSICSSCSALFDCSRLKCCDVSTGTQRPFVPEFFHRQGVWCSPQPWAPGRSDIRKNDFLHIYGMRVYVKSMIQSERHSRALASVFLTPDARF